MKGSFRLIIGLAGMPGCGKTTVAAILQDKGFTIITLSSFIKDKLRKQGQVANRQNLQNQGDQLRSCKGAAILAKMALAKIKKLQLKKVVIDGIRNQAEIKSLKQTGHFFLIGMAAHSKLRFRRLKLAQKHPDLKTWQDFVVYELRENRGLNSQTGLQNQLCYLLADCFLENNGSIPDLKKKLAKIVKQIK